ncbi:MAG: carbohydrate kinase family protein [Anaerolineaceae bacterium]|nr:carbohydrate kinase family protein [Anaerolineaceae bacterium]
MSVKMKVTCVGGANIDIQGFSNAKVNMRDSNPGTIRLCPGGVGRNIAENLAWLGADVTMVSAIGSDFFADLILKSCHDAGINTDHIEVIPDAHSSAYLVLTDSDGDMLAAISDMHIMKQLGADFILRHGKAFDRADAVVLDPNLSKESLEVLTSRWAHKPLFADPISTAYAGTLKQFLPRLFMVKCNRQEAEIFADMSISNENDLDIAADTILNTGTKCVVITLGSDGVFYKDHNGLKYRKFHKPLEPVSSTGAGDSFTAAMVYAWLCGLPAERSLELAMNAAEITIMDVLTVSPKIRSLTMKDKTE